MLRRIQRCCVFHAGRGGVATGGLYWDPRTSFWIHNSSTSGWRRRIKTTQFGCLSISLANCLLPLQTMELCTLLLLEMVIQVDSLTLWPIARPWPLLMPVHSNSTVLPTFFSTSCLRDVPCIVPNGELSQRYTATNLSLLHTLCFTLKNSSLPCIWLRRTTLANLLDPMSNSAMGTDHPGCFESSYPRSLFRQWRHINQ